LGLTYRFIIVLFVLLSALLARSKMVKALNLASFALPALVLRKVRLVALNVNLVLSLLFQALLNVPLARPTQLRIASRRCALVTSVSMPLALVQT